MKNYIKALISVLLFGSYYANAQPATVSYPFAVGRQGCGSGTQQIHYYTYNGGTNTIANATGGVVGPCIPQLRIGTTGGPSPYTQRFTSSLASVSFNPKDHKIYYLWTALPPNSLATGGIARTYAWSWAAGACTGTAAAKTDTIRSFAADILGVAFDNNGKGYILEFTGEPNGVPHKTMIRSIDFSTGVLGAADTLLLTGGAKIYVTGSGDVAMSPSGQMFFVVNNKLFTPNYQGYTGTGANLTCTYIDTVRTSNNFVGLTYAQGETIAAYSGGGCPFEEVQILTGINSAITKNNTPTTVYSAADLATVISGIGASKQLVSAIPTGTPNQYDITYDILVKNYGNTDVTNVQVTDDLKLITNLLPVNVNNVAASIVGAAPAGIAINPSYDGKTNINLLNGTGTLPNFPVASSSFTIRITCQFSSIQTGVVYNNSAIATGVGFNAQNLRDSSTNGTNPDLNTNDKPDDVGEGQPTPLLISITSQTAPCTALGQVLYTQNFGTGAGKTASFPASPTAGTEYTGTITHPLPTDRFMIADNARAGDSTRFVSLTDHTGGGRMLIINADAANNALYRDTITTVCAGQQYSLIFYAAFVGNSSYQTICDAFGGFKYPKVKMRIRDRVSGAIITEASTADITSTSWNQYGLKWVMPSGFGDIIFELINDAPGGCGNDIVIDDIQFGTCDGLPTVSISAPADGCLGAATVFNAALSDAGALPGAKEYQWQVSPDNVAWANLGGVTTTGTYTINPLTAGDIGKYYRVLVAATGNIGSASCRYTSPGFLLTAKSPSTAPTSISQSRTTICSGDPVRLTVNGGSLGTNAEWRWYSTSCGGTLIGTGTNIIVNPTVATTYYVRAEGDCNNTACAQVTLTMNCDIDDDNDGIPDYVEGNGTDPSEDVDSDAILNYLDTDLAGFVDTNTDGINDIFDADLDGVPNHLDLDSDNDGIPDTVESGGVDTDGDGRIDNYTDTDADGFSQNVDGNNTGAAGSGSGLGALDTDGDSAPNYFDLDSDNDGIPDVVEVYGTDANNNGRIDGYTDTDADGFSNNVDGDVGNDGTAENAANTLLRTGADGDGNGRADSYTYKNIDNDSKPNPYDLDSDGDGITDVKESGFSDTDWNGRVDGSYNTNGWSTVIAALPALGMPNSDASGRVNVYDADSDNDGIPDNIEGQTTPGYLLSSGADGDLDGISNSYDNFAGFGGDGIHALDTDGDTIPDFIDTDTDSDGVPDIIEGNDFNLNGLLDDNVTLTGVDTDDDGLDNRFDNTNLSAKGTSAYMGTGGSLSGDASPGSVTTVQQSAMSASAGCGTERDWRCLGFVLKCEIITFKAALQGQSVQLDWTAMCRQEVDYFIVQRSSDKVSFTDIGVVNGKPVLNEIDAYHGNDDISTIKPEIIYYRLKAVMQNGETSVSNIISVRRDNRKGNIVQIFPNPVNDQLQVSINAATSFTTQIYILDGNGKPVKKYAENILPGNNIFTYSETRNLPNGVYYLRLNLGEQLIIQKFSVLK